jgi:hypothetical protein
MIPESTMRVNFEPGSRNRSVLGERGATAGGRAAIGSVGSRDGTWRHGMKPGQATTRNLPKAGNSGIIRPKSCESHQSVDRGAT